jgi:hypothetical protein
VGIAIAPTPRDVGMVGEGAIAAFAWVLPDNDLVRRGNARILADVIVTRDGDEWKPRSNVHEQLRSLARDSGRAENPGRSVLFYAYAVLSSSWYLETFAGMVEAAGDPRMPLRLPVPKDPRRFGCIADLGERLAQLENPGHRFDSLPSISANWHLYRTGTFALARWRWSEGRLCLIDEHGEVFADVEVDSETIGTRIGGHSVVDSWLELRRRPSLNREFAFGDFEQMVDLLRRLRSRSEIIRQVDERLKQLMGIANALLTPPRRASSSSTGSE